MWCSRGGLIGSLLILTGNGDVDGGGVLLDTAKCGRPLQNKILQHYKLPFKPYLFMYITLSEQAM